MYLFQATGSKIIRQYIKMEKVCGIYQSKDLEINLLMQYGVTNPKEEDLDVLQPFNNNKYSMFSFNGDVMRYIDMVTECRKQELTYKEMQIETLKNQINEKNFE